MHFVLRFMMAILLMAMSASAALAQGTPVATPDASPVAGGEDREISFESGLDTLYGSLRVPAGLDAPAPGVLIISGSGPTDRNGDSAGLPLGTNRHIADDFEALGVVSFRYDKLGSGETGMASRPTGEGVDYELFLREAWDAFDVLASQPEVDPERIIVLGHSEGALFALDMATDESRETRPAGIVLAAPLGVRYLDLLREQFGNALDEYVALQPSAEAEADEALEELDAAIEEIRETGELTTTLSHPAMAGLFNPANIDFLSQADQRDPAELAAAIPADMPVLIIHGEKDEQVTVEHVDRVEQAFLDAGHGDVTRVDIADANHIFQVIEGEPNAALDYPNQDLPFSPGVGEALEEYLAAFE